jgi:hydroxyisourate hydrolase
MARISTHILDIAKGQPAAGIAIDLVLAGKIIVSAITNADGRTDKPLLESFEPGIYELIFHTGGPFFDDITIRFHVTEPEANYHVPLLLAPHGYSTYRGS